MWDLIPDDGESGGKEMAAPGNHEMASGRLKQSKLHHT